MSPRRRIAPGHQHERNLAAVGADQIDFPLRNGARLVKTHRVTDVGTSTKGARLVVVGTVRTRYADRDDVVDSQIRAAVQKKSGGAVDRITTGAVGARIRALWRRRVTGSANTYSESHDLTQAGTRIGDDLFSIRRDGPVAVDLPAGRDVVIPKLDLGSGWQPLVVRVHDPQGVLRATIDVGATGLQREIRRERHG